MTEAASGIAANLGGLHHVTLSVSDLDASVTWYCEVLGLVDEVRIDSDARRSAILRFPSTRQQLGLIEHKPSGSAFRPQNLGLDHVAFDITTHDEMEAWLDRLNRHKIPTPGILGTPFGAMLHFKDPDGIALALFWTAEP